MRFWLWRALPLIVAARGAGWPGAEHITMRSGSKSPQATPLAATRSRARDPMRVQAGIRPRPNAGLVDGAPEMAAKRYCGLAAHAVDQAFRLGG
jgi:hypothetical protein